MKNDTFSTKKNIFVHFIRKWPWPFKWKVKVISVLQIQTSCGKFIWNIKLYERLCICITTQIVTLYIHCPFSLRQPLTFNLDLQNIGKIATNIFGTYSSRWTVWYITTLIYNEDKSEVYVLLSESIRNENSAFADVCYIVICYITVYIRQKHIHLSYNIV